VCFAIGESGERWKAPCLKNQTGFLCFLYSKMNARAMALFRFLAKPKGTLLSANNIEILIGLNKTKKPIENKGEKKMKKNYQAPAFSMTLVMQDVIMASATDNFGKYKSEWY
jgi:hypothetical protein